jgi:membrane-bound lytic murein transglycosylase D
VLDVNHLAVLAPRSLATDRSLAHRSRPPARRRSRRLGIASTVLVGVALPFLAGGCLPARQAQDDVSTPPENGGTPAGVAAAATQPPAPLETEAPTSALLAGVDSGVRSTDVLDASADELLAAAETALLIAGERVGAGDTEGYRLAMAECLSYLDEAQSQIAADPNTFPMLREAYEKLLAQLREGLDPSATEENVLVASPAELAGTRGANYKNGASYEMPIDADSKLVQKYLALFQRGKRRSYIEHAFERSGRYREFVLEEIRARGLPEELWVIPIIESGYKTSAYSRTRAVGIWQFMAATARNYGLTVNEWIDERRDPVKATRAALDYLKDLYLWFNNWDFALAAYNRGEHGIHRDIRNSGIVDFMEMAELGATHRETQNHVPQIHAAAIIAKNPGKYGFDFDFESPVAADTVRIDYVVDLEVAAQCAGTSETTLRELNPEIRTWVTPVLSPDYPSYALKLPAGSRERYLEAIGSVADLTPKRQIQYVVRRGDTLGSIGRRFGVPWGKIKSWNNLRSSRIYPGQKLVIFPGNDRGARALATAGGSSRSAASRRTTTTLEGADGEQQRIYTVRRGDTLTHIAKAFGVSVAQLKAWNGVGSRIYPGQKLKVGAAVGGEGEPIVYVVKRGDTLSGIARSHRTTVALLKTWNRVGRYLQPGQKLKIYRTD